MSNLSWLSGAILMLMLGIMPRLHVASAHDVRFYGQTTFPRVVTPAQPPTAHQSITDHLPLRAVIDQYKLWETGTTLRACFMGGTQEERQFFVDTASLWTNLANIRIDFGHAPGYLPCEPWHPSHLRIAFQNDGNWSHVGTDALRIAVDQPTINIAAIAEQPLSLANKNYLRGVVLHELGHAFALQHEHQSPEARCDQEMNWDLVYTDLMGPPNNWTREVVNQNLRPLTSSLRLRTTAYDRQSIMHYSFPARWFINGTSNKCWVVRNDNLSETDKGAIQLAYPATFEAQARYIAVLDTQAKTAVDVLQIPEDMQQALQAEINKVLNDQMKRHGVTSAFINAPVTVTGNTQHGGPGSNQMQGSVSGTVNQTTTNQSPTHIQGNQIHQTGSGPCAPNVAGVGGNVTINADCPGKQ